MKGLDILVIGGGIGGLTAAIALRAKGHAVDVIERDPNWTVYGVGIIQQGNVVRTMAALGLIDDYLDAGYGYDAIEIFMPSGESVAKIPAQRLVPAYPANVGIGRPALHKVLGDRAIGAGAKVRLGVTIDEMSNLRDGVIVQCSDATIKRYDIVVGADGLYSQTRCSLFPSAPVPRFTGQSVWRYNLPRPAEVTGLRAFNGPIGVGMVPLSNELMYIFVTTPEPDNPRYAREGLAAAMREKLKDFPAPVVQALARQIVDDEAVVYKPLDVVFLEGPWHKGRVVLLGDAIHATTPHLGQGAGMAIEDAVVLAEEIERAERIEQAFVAYRARRFERCRYIVEASLAICLGQIGKGPLVETSRASREMFEHVAKPI